MSASRRTFAGISWLTQSVVHFWKFSGLHLCYLQKRILILKGVMFYFACSDKDRQFWSDRLPPYDEGSGLDLVTKQHQGDLQEQ